MGSQVVLLLTQPRRALALTSGFKISIVFLRLHSCPPWLCQRQLYGLAGKPHDRGAPAMDMDVQAI